MGDPACVAAVRDHTGEPIGDAQSTLRLRQ